MSNQAIVPIPKIDLAIRVAVASDLAFIDRLQQMHSKAVGFMPTKQLEQKIERGEVLIAEGNVKHEDMKHEEGASSCFMSSCFTSPLGYCISSDRYFKRDEVGIIYQMNIVPSAQRKLVAASLLKSVFERAPYGCRLYCCWCAQDLAANYFWESMGFIPLAFRTGAVGKKGAARTHIFWQRRIREGDVGQGGTPFWYPCKTDGGSLRGDRLVLPIPPGVRWSDEMPVLLPTACLPTAGVPNAGVPRRGETCLAHEEGDTSVAPTKRLAEPAKARRAVKEQKIPTLMPPTRRRARFGSPTAIAPATVAPTSVAQSSIAQSGPVVEQAVPVKPKREKAKADPAHVKAARELRDKYLERFNGGLALPEAKYAVGREESEDGGLRIEDGSAPAPSSIPSTYSGQALHLPSSSRAPAA